MDCSTQDLTSNECFDSAILSRPSRRPAGLTRPRVARRGLARFAGALAAAACLSLVGALLLPATVQAQNYTPLDGLRVSDGRVQFLFASAGQCIQLSNSSINGVVYTTHTSKWQIRSGSSWVDIPGTERNGLCSYSPTSPGEYRLVAEISIGGQRGFYSSENTLDRRGGAARHGNRRGIVLARSLPPNSARSGQVECARFRVGGGTSMRCS